jgi:prophage antirepressor-like protein
MMKDAVRKELIEMADNKNAEIPPKIAVFKGKEIRKTIHNNEWWFVVEDVVLALIDSSNPKQYLQRMKLRDPELQKGWVQIVHTLSVQTEGGAQSMNCANTKSTRGLTSRRTIYAIT